MKSVGHKKLPQISQIHTDSLSLTQVLHKRKIFFKLFVGKDTTFPRNFQGFRGKCREGDKEKNRRLPEWRVAY